MLLYLSLAIQGFAIHCFDYSHPIKRSLTSHLCSNYDLLFAVLLLTFKIIWNLTYAKSKENLYFVTIFCFCCFLLSHSTFLLFSKLNILRFPCWWVDWWVFKKSSFLLTEMFIFLLFWTQSYETFFTCWRSAITYKWALYCKLVHGRM